MTAAAEAVAPEAEGTQEEPEAQVLQLPLFEGHRTVETRLNFGGNLLVTDQELAEGLTLGAEIEIRGTARVVSRNFKQKDNGQAVSSAAIVFDSIELV